MPNNGKTIFQNLSSIMGISKPEAVGDNQFLSNSLPGNEILFATNDKAEYERKVEQYKQEKYLAYQWQRAAVENNMESLASYTAVKLMYRDCDLMDGVPEIGTALDIIADEVCNLSSDNQILKVSSKSKRIKSILEDLFYNRLQVATSLRMISRGMVKYGNHYMLLNVTKNGIAGWRQLSVYETDRYEGGLSGYYGGGQLVTAGEDLKPDEVRFVHAGMNQSTSYSEWQVAHFRLLNDSFFLPYGVSLLHKARRAWRMWSMMEDAMLIYRLDKSIERRVFKIYVGGINDKDVPAFVQEIANNFKRTPIIDPLTGQVDLRKNFLDVSSDYFIPVRDPSAPNPIETLQAAHNDTSMDDINYMQNKIFAAIRVPKAFINFQDAQGKGQNLSLADIRFARMIMGIQQFVLAELNKVAMVHLYLLGFKEELTNFSLSMNIPTAQIESLELDALAKRIQTASQALADPGIGMPMVSLHWVQTNILKLSDNEIKDILGEIRLEKAMAAELQMTPAIIKKTGLCRARAWAAEWVAASEGAAVSAVTSEAVSAVTWTLTGHLTEWRVEAPRAPLTWPRPRRLTPASLLWNTPTGSRESPRERQWLSVTLTCSPRGRRRGMTTRVTARAPFLTRARARPGTLISFWRGLRTLSARKMTS